MCKSETTNERITRLQQRYQELKADDGVTEAMVSMDDFQALFEQLEVYKTACEEKQGTNREFKSHQEAKAYGHESTETLNQVQEVCRRAEGLEQTSISFNTEDVRTLLDQLELYQAACNLNKPLSTEENEATHIGYCAYCGWNLKPDENGLVDIEELEQHIEVCPKHPITKIKAQRDLLSVGLTALGMTFQDFTNIKHLEKQLNLFIQRIKQLIVQNQQPEELHGTIQEAIQAEREACAQLLDKEAETVPNKDGIVYIARKEELEDAAELIRKRYQEQAQPIYVTLTFTQLASLEIVHTLYGNFGGAQIINPGMITLMSDLSSLLPLLMRSYKTDREIRIEAEQIPTIRTDWVSE